MTTDGRLALATGGAGCRRRTTGNEGHGLATVWASRGSAAKVRRLLRDGHEIEVRDHGADVVTALAGEGAEGAR
jgi:hypothetical protein